MKTHLGRITLLFVCLFLLEAAFAEAAYRDTIEKSFKVKPGGHLILDTDRGSIEVYTHEGNTVKVTVKRKVDVSDREEAKEILERFNIDFDHNGRDVRIRAEFDEGGLSFWRRIRKRLKLRYIIVVPQKYNVDLQTAGGSISVEDLQGEVRSKTSGGSLTFGNIDGPVWGRTSGGSVTLDGCKGIADVKTSGGSIYIGEVDGNVQAFTSGGSIKIVRARGEVMAKTSGGSIKVDEVTGAVDAATSGGNIKVYISAQPQRDCKLRTSGGSIYAYIADGIKLDLEASTSGGHVETEFPVTVQGKISKSSLRAKINGGGPLLILKTSGGSIYLKSM